MATGTKKYSLWRFFLCSLFVATFSILLLGVNGDAEELPSESQCRPYIEKALKDFEAGELHPAESEESPAQDESTSGEDNSAEIATDTDQSASAESTEEPSLELADEPFVEEVIVQKLDAEESAQEESNENDSEEMQGDQPADDASAESSQVEADAASAEEEDSKEVSAEDTNAEDESANASSETTEEASDEAEAETEGEVEAADDQSKEGDSEQDSGENAEADASEESAEKVDSKEEDKSEEATDAEDASKESEEQTEDSKEDADSKEQEGEDSKESVEAQEEENASVESVDAPSAEESEEAKDESGEEQAESESVEDKAESEEGTPESAESGEDKAESEEDKAESAEDKAESTESGEDKAESGEDKAESAESAEKAESIEDTDAKEAEGDSASAETASVEETAEESTEAPAEAEPEASEEEEPAEETPEEDLLQEVVIPDNLRSKDHIGQILRLDEESTESEMLMDKSADIILRELKKIYENAIKPLEVLYKYRDLSNRHYGDPEIFSKPLVLFMGPWSGGKSSLINYLTENEFTEWSLRTGAEPSPAYFNILMHGKEPAVLDGTQLAADWTFSGLQKFGQGLEERLRGLKLPNKLLEKVNIVEIPGILEVRKQVSRVFPFNDACQWFIDRADIIFLVYDPSKLDVGPETEAILDQLKGREAQTRIILNKADQVKAEELLRVQSALIWNISPLMSSAQPPVMYTTSLWSMPYEVGSPSRLLQSQEYSFLRDLREAIDKRIDNKIASARRFAVRVRNHAKMVDCYLTTYYNHKTIFGNKKVVAEAIIEHPQNYHIYEGLSTLTNISRYDLPDPETYRDFFRLNPLYEFQQLSATCTYFRGCPINRLDVAIAYDFPELVGKYKKMVETATPQGMPKS